MSLFSKLEARLLRDGKLFEDHDFPAASQSLGDTAVEKGVEWKRPKELSNEPKFLTNRDDKFDVTPSGNCAFISALHVLENNKTFLSKVVPSVQTFKGSYAGLFHFYIWENGKYTEVIIDDRLPVLSSGDLYTCDYKAEHNGFWAPLLEKAYAKFLGSYVALNTVLVTNVLVDFIGGIPENYVINKEEEIPEDLFEAIQTSLKQGAIVGAGTWKDDKENNIKRIVPDDKGLSTGNLYLIREITKEQLDKDTSIKLVKLKNLGGEVKWKGAWSENSQEWGLLSSVSRKRMRCAKTDCWLSFRDLLKTFHELSFVHIVGCMVYESSYVGSWIHGITAGGDGKTSQNKDSYFCNPQYHFTLRLKDCNENYRASVIICVEQKETLKRQSKTFKAKQSYCIGYSIHEISDGVPEPITKENYTDRAVFCTQVHSATPSRHVSHRHCLSPGVYCILPYTLKPNQETDFYLRIGTENEIHTCFVDEPTGLTNSRSVKKLDSEEILHKDSVLCKDVFLKYCSDEGDVDGRDLRVLLNHLLRKDLGDNSGGFNLEPCRSLLAMFDIDGQGVLGYEETRTLWETLQSWRTTFKNYDAGRSGFIETFDLRKVFKEIGFNLGSEMVSVIASRYGGKQEMVSFEDFVLCASRSMAMYATYMKYSQNGQSSDARITLDQWMCTTLNY